MAIENFEDLQYICMEKLLVSWFIEKIQSSGEYDGQDLTDTLRQFYKLYGNALWGKTGSNTTVRRAFASGQ